MKRLQSLLILLAGFLAGPVLADDLVMVRVAEPFPETMAALQQAISDHGYTVSRVQRVDVGLEEFGFETDRYRVVFFGKADETNRLADEYPRLMPYLPLKIAIFAEGADTLLVAARPTHLSPYFEDPELRDVFERWTEDMESLMHEVADE